VSECCSQIQCLNFVIFSKDPLATFMLRFCLAFSEIEDGGGGGGLKLIKYCS
jgi:hypothetical protein